MKRKNIALCALALTVIGASAQENTTDTISKLQQEQHLKSVNVTARRPGTMRMKGADNTTLITGTELRKAACCNLGESFTTNPSVDVAYADAATGARQIKLLGLSGSYVQMLADNIPNYRGLAAPYSLGYIPGPWMQGIQVSKGSSSVKNGYESITGQINVGFKEANAVDQVNFNAYANSEAKVEANADANVHLNDHLSTGLLLHFEDRYKDMDDNGDTFVDDPNVQQYNFQNRWFYSKGIYIFHGAVSALKERRRGGQIGDHAGAIANPYLIDIETDRYDAYLKNAFFINEEHNTNVALMTSASWHRQNSLFGKKTYDAIQRNLYASLVFETEFDEHNSLSTGYSMNRDYFTQNFGKSVVLPHESTEAETVNGIYAQYTLNLHNKFVLMAGLRGDISSLYDDAFVTPRAHLKWEPSHHFALRASAGKGYRTMHVLAENNYMLTSGRQLTVENTGAEEAWNYGLSATAKIPVAGHGLTINAEYYRTEFSNQVVIDYDADPSQILVHNLRGNSYSNTFQVDATYTLFQGLTLTAAYRLNDVKCAFDRVGLKEKPLTSKYKGLLSATYKTPLGLWQFDATLQLNGGGRLPDYYDDGKLMTDQRFKGFEQVQAQITREFRHFSVYLGGENLTGFRQKNPIVNASGPWSSGFDPTLTWGPVKGRMFYAGIRINFEKMD